MANQRIKGQEVEISIVADGQTRTFTDIQSSEFSQETETTEEGYLGEKSNRYDEIYKGYTGNVSMHNSSPELLDFLQVIKDRAQRRTPGIVINVKMTLAFPSGERSRIIMQDAFFDASGISFGSRTDYGSTSIPFKGSEYRVI
jgi:hypothetical protein